MMDERVRIVGSMILDKVKGEKFNVDPVHTTKTYKGGFRSIALFFFNLGDRWW